MAYGSDGSRLVEQWRLHFGAPCLAAVTVRGEEVCQTDDGEALATSASIFASPSESLQPGRLADDRAVIMNKQKREMIFLWPRLSALQWQPRHSQWR